MKTFTLQLTVKYNLLLNTDQWEIMHTAYIVENLL